jgi:hypothetical protein
MIILRKKEVERIEVKKWTLVFGRRKTGKTFLVENFIKSDQYFFINRDRTVISKNDGVQITYDVFAERLKTGAKSGETITIDEFHRLGEPFLDLLQSIGKGGKIILLTSTLFLAKRLIAARSPIMGLFNEVQIPIISLQETLEALADKKLDNKSLVEMAIMLREPIAIEFFDEKRNSKSMMNAILSGSANAVPALFGEILIEEDKGTSAIYEGIIRAIADGKVTSGNISSSLFSKRLITKDDPSFVQSYLGVMVLIGLLKRIKVYNKNKFVYKIVSPLVRLFFYADEKYGISQRQITEIESERIISELLPHIVEDNIREYVADRLGLEEAVLEAGDYDIDGILIKFKKPSVLLEVKWGKIDAKVIEKVEQNLGKIEGDSRILFVNEKKGLSSSSIKIMDIHDLRKLSQRI